MASLIPEIRLHLPGMNMLVATYGHSHISALILFILPLFWEFWESDKNKLLKTVFFVFLIFIMLTSFGRTAVMISFAETFILAWKRRKFLSQKMRYIAVFILSLLIFGIIVLFGFSIYTSWMGFSSCPVPQFQLQLCKSLKDEPRGAYWQQAISGTLHRPFFGWGGGSFSIISNLYTTDGYQYSAYAHNEYLQIIAEYGLITGVIFITMCGIIFYVSFCKIFLSPTKGDSNFFLALGVLALLVDNFFDYDWEFIALWLLFLLGAAYLLSTSTRKFFSSSKFTHIEDILHRYTVTICKVLIVIFSSTYLVSTFLWKTQNYDLSLRIFPFIYWQVEEKIGSDQITSSTTEWLYNLYQNHVLIVGKLQSRTQDKNQKILALRKLNLLDENKYFFVFVEELAQEHQWQDFNQYLNSFRLEQITALVTDAQLAQVAEASIKGGNETLKSGKFQLAGELYENAYRLTPSSLGKTSPEILRGLQFYTSKMDTSFIDRWDTTQLTDYTQPLMVWYWQRLINAVNIQNWDQIELTVWKLISLDKLNAPKIWEKTSILLDEIMVNAIRTGNFSLAKEASLQWKHIYQILLSLPPNTSLFHPSTCQLIKDIQFFNKEAEKTGQEKLSIDDIKVSCL